jgi:hypothetical protein
MLSPCLSLRLGLLFASAVVTGCARTAPASAPSQNVDIVSLPSGPQSILQPAATSLTINRFENIRFADQFPGADIGAQINAAIADLGTAGGVVEVPAGTYSFGTTIQLSQSYTWLRCQGWATVLNYTGSGTAVIFGNSTAPGASPATLDAVHFSDCTLRGQGTGTGIYVEAGMQVGNLIEHINFDDTGLGFQTFIVHGDTTGNSADYSVNDNLILNNRIMLNPSQSSSYAGVGIDVRPRSHNLVIAHNFIKRRVPAGMTNPSDGSICVRVTDSSSVKIVDNNIEGCGAANVQVGLTESESMQAYGTVVRGNYFEPLDAATISIDVGKYAVGTVIDGNYMSGDALQSYLIQIEDCSYGTIIQNNTQLSPAQSVINNLTSNCSQAITISGNRYNGTGVSYTHGTAGIVYWQDPNEQTLTLGGVAFASLPSPTVKPNGTFLYCSDCNAAPTCSAGGQGALAHSVAGAWVCN